MSLVSAAARFADVPPGKPPEKPKNLAHKIAAGISAGPAVIGRGVELLNTGFAMATNALASMLPAFPAATLGSLAIGAPHAHTLHPPSGPLPIPPTPLPPIGPVLLGTCQSVLINGQPAARCGDLGINPTCCGLPPFYEVFTGSSNVFIGGARAARQSDVTFHCKPVPPAGAAARGAISAARIAMNAASAAMIAAGLGAQAAQAIGDSMEADKAQDPEMQAALGMSAGIGAAQMATDAAAIAAGLIMGKDACVPPGTPGMISQGSGNVLIGGLPMPSWINIAKGLFKLVKGLKGRCKKKAGKCPGGEPVDLVTGENFDEFVDVELPGSVPFVWKRYYSSEHRERNGPLGYSFRHDYQRSLRPCVDGYLLEQLDGSEVFFAAAEVGQEQASDGYVLRRIDERTFHVHRPDGLVMEFRFSDPDVPDAVRLTRVIGAEGSLGLHHDAHGVLLAVTTAEGRTVELSHDAQGRIVALVLVDERREHSQTLAAYDYGADGNLVRFTDALGHSAHYEYDDARLMTRKTDRRGYSYHYVYDGAGRCIHVRGNDGLYECRMEYRPEERSARLEYGDGGVWHYYYSDDKTVHTIIDPNGGTYLWQRDEAGRVVERIDSGGHPKRDLFDEVTGAPLGTENEFGDRFDPGEANRYPQVERDLPQHALGREHGSRLDPDSIEPASPHDPLLAQFPFTQPVMVPQAHADDAAGEPTEDFFGHSIQRTDSAGGLWRTYCDALGRKVQEIDPQGRMRRFGYDGQGNLETVQDRDGAVWRTEYTSWNLEGRTLDPLGNATSYAYQVREQCTEVVDAGGTKSEYVYDQKDRLVEVRRGGGVHDRYIHDLGDHLVEKQDGAGRTLAAYVEHDRGLPGVVHLGDDTVRLSYDERGRLTGAFRAPDVRREGGYTVKLGYDDFTGRVVSDERDGRGVVHETGDDETQTTKLLGRFTIRHSEDALTDAVVIQQPGGGDHRVRFSQGGLVLRELANGTAELSQYDSEGRCLLKVVGRSDRPRDAWTRRYRYSAEGDLEAVEDSEAGTIYYEYNAAHQLVAERYEDGSVARYSYDGAGNLLSAPGLAGVTLEQANRLASANGEQVVYDQRQHVSERGRDPASGRGNG